MKGIPIARGHARFQHPGSKQVSKTSFWVPNRRHFRPFLTLISIQSTLSLRGVPFVMLNRTTVTVALIICDSSILVPYVTQNPRTCCVASTLHRKVQKGLFQTFGNRVCRFAATIASNKACCMVVASQYFQRHRPYGSLQAFQSFTVPSSLPVA